MFIVHYNIRSQVLDDAFFFLPILSQLLLLWLISESRDFLHYTADYTALSTYILYSLKDILNIIPVQRSNCVFTFQSIDVGMSDKIDEVFFFNCPQRINHVKIQKHRSETT